MEKVVKHYDDCNIRLINITDSIDHRNMHDVLKKYRYGETYNMFYKSNRKTDIVYFERNELTDILFRTVITSINYGENYKHNYCFFCYRNHFTCLLTDKSDPQLLIDLIDKHH